MGWADNLRLQSILPVALSMMGGQDDNSLVNTAATIASNIGRNRRPMYEDSPESGGYGGNLPHPTVDYGLGSNRVNWPTFDSTNQVANNTLDNTDNLPSRVSPQLEMQIPGGNPTSSNPRAIGDIANDPTAFELFKRSILGMPERNRPNIWRALGTGALSTANMLEGKGGKPLGYDEASHILYDPYEQAVARWGKQTGALKDLSTIEGQTARAEGLPEQRRASAEANLRRAGVAETAEQRKAREGEANIQLRQRKLDIDEWKAKNPTGKIVMPKGGNVILVNPQSGETTDTGIPTGSLSDADKIEFEHRNQVSDINLRHANEIKTLEEKHQQTLSEIGARGAETRTTQSAGITQRGEEARKTKGTPSVSTVKYESTKQPGSTTTVQGVPGGAVTAKTSTGTAPKIGDTKKFPNGRMGKWDGTAWRPI